MREIELSPAMATQPPTAAASPPAPSQHSSTARSLTPSTILHPTGQRHRRRRRGGPTLGLRLGRGAFAFKGLASEKRLLSVVSASRRVPLGARSPSGRRAARWSLHRQAPSCGPSRSGRDERGVGWVRGSSDVVVEGRSLVGT